MSNVPKSKRKLSDLEFYNNALKLRRLATSWLLRDFGIKPTRRSPENFIKRYRFTQEDAERFTEVLDRYGLGQGIYEHFEEWWINARRLQIDKGIQDILHYIRKANAIYPTCEQEYYERRLLQDRAIGACEVLLDDLAFVAETGHIVKRVVSKKVRRERKKLRAYRKLLTNGKLSRLEISNAYQSWRGNCKRFNARRTVRAMDKFYNGLFVEQ